MSNITKHDPDTRVEAGGTKVTTNLTIDWDGLTPEEMRELAAQSIIIKWQGQCRSAKSVPTEANLKATDYKLGVRAPRKPKTFADLWAAMSDAEKAEFLAKHANQ